MLWELILDETDKDCWFSHSRVPNDDGLIKVVKLLDHTFRINIIINHQHQDYSPPSSTAASSARRAYYFSFSIFSPSKNFFIRTYSPAIIFLSSFSLAFSALLSVIAFLRVLSTSLAKACCLRISFLASSSNSKSRQKYRQPLRLAWHPELRLLEFQHIKSASALKTDGNQSHFWRIRSLRHNSWCSAWYLWDIVWRALSKRLFCGFLFSYPSIS